MLFISDLVRAQMAHHDHDGEGARPKLKALAAELTRMRFQVLFGLVATLFLPILIRRGPDALFLDATYADPAPMGNVLAFLFGFYVFRQVSAFPGVRTTSSIVPAFTLSYAATAAFYLALRLDYRVGEFALSFLIAVLFFYGIGVVQRRVKRARFAVIPGGQVGRVLTLGHVDWHVVSSPAEVKGSMPLVVDLHSDLSEEWDRCIAEHALRGLPVYNFKQLYESMTGRVQVAHISENMLGTLAPNEIWSSAKRYVDFAAAVVVLVFACWLMAAIALIIRLESPGPAIFKQQRLGLGARPFTMYKFRTMRVLTPEEEARNNHYHEARRITRFGAFLRRSRLDELPQLFNILKGEMSWIGPRPEAMSLSAEYAANIPFYLYRQIVRPGITGWAQVNQGHVVGVEHADDKLQYDFFYIRNFSLWLDILVGLRTFRVILTGSGAR